VPTARTRAVLLDSLGTLIELDSPVPRLRAALERLGFAVDEEMVARAFGAEVAYYIEHHVEGRDQSSLADLRNRCAAVFRDALRVPELSPRDAREVLLGSLGFRAFPDAAPALRELRGRGLRLVVVSNWDCSLPEVLADAGLLELVDGAVPSAVAGAAKPDPAAFRAALATAHCAPDEAVHVGDSQENDVAGARAAGVRAVLLRRDGGPAPGVPTIAGLGELAAVI
jgi:HAD superfamily hydrolase (TIGR01549 family)